MAQAGWYDDPDVPGGFRYWDGAEWTAHRRAAPAEPDPSPRSGRGPSVRSILVAVVLVALGAFAVTRFLGGDEPESAGSTTTTTSSTSGGGIGDNFAGVEACQTERRTIATALDAWKVMGGSGIPEESDPTSGYPMTLELLRDSEDPGARLLVPGFRTEQWSYDHTVGPESLRVWAEGEFAAVAVICNAG